MKIKFLTINILHGGEVWEPLIQFLKNEDADIVAIQEANNAEDKKYAKNFRTVSEFKKIFNYKYNSFAPNVIILDKNGEYPEGNFILSKFSILNEKNIFFEAPLEKFNCEGVTDFRLFPSALQVVEIEINHKKINLFNIHGIWDFHGNDTPRRLNMSEKIISEIKGKENVILTGDSNVKYKTKTIKNIEEYLTNIFDGKLKTTFNMKRKTNQGYASAAVDIIMVSKEIKVLEASCPNVDISDHLPLIAELEI